MPLYDYHCESNGIVIEVHHSMSESIKTWGELCEQSKHPIGDTPADTPVARLVGSGSSLNMQNTVSFRERKRAIDSPTVMPMRDNKY